MSVNVAPILNLTDDVLYELFETYLFLAYDEAKLDNFFGARSYKRDQLKITHVCRRWRDVAVCAPRLWTIIFDTQPEFLTELIKRSKMAPLTIHWSASEEDVASIKALLNQFSRVENINLTLNEKTHKEIAHVAPQSAPFLKAVTFRSTFRECEIGGRPLPTVLDNCEMPNLQMVRLDGYEVTGWSKTLFSPSLTHLDIRTHYYTTFSPTAVPFAETLAAIARMSSLVDLALADCIAALTSNHPFPAISPKKRITLTHLQSLYLSSQALPCVHFLDHLIVPASASVSPNFTYDPSLPAATKLPIIFDSILSKLQRPTVIGQRQTFLSASIHNSGEHYIDLCLCSDTHDASHLNSDDPNNFPTPSFRVIIYDDSETSPVNTWTFFGTLPIQGVKVLRIEDCAAELRPYSAMLALFRQMPNISTLLVTALSRLNWLRKILMSHMSPVKEEDEDMVQVVAHNPYLLSHLRTLDVNLPFVDSRADQSLRRYDMIALVICIMVEREIHGIGLDVFNMQPPVERFFRVNQRQLYHIHAALEWEERFDDHDMFKEFNTDNESDYDSNESEDEDEDMVTLEGLGNKEEDGGENELY